MRHIPKYLIYLSGLVSTVFFVICGIQFPSSKSLGIWLLFGGIVFGLLTGFLYWQIDIWENQIQSKKNLEAQINKTEDDLNNKRMPSQEGPLQKSNNEKNKMSEETKPTIIAPNSVFSIDQKGGITAHTVNLAPQPRHVSSEQREILLRNLKNQSLQLVKISYGEADPEQKQFALELIDVLKAAGCELEITSALYMMTPYEKGLTFEVNKTPPFPKGSEVLQKALKEAHIDAQWVGTSEMKRDLIWMVVGKQ